jgi:hypothetical protein
VCMCARKKRRFFFPKTGRYQWASHFVSKAVISLAPRWIHKYADKHVGTFFLRWCLMCICGFHQVFVGAQTADAWRGGF